MPKYIVEGAVDFFSELYKSLDDEDDDDDNVCLITNTPLTENFVQLNCGHKFNYLPLFKDIYNHKKNFNYLESSSGKLGKNEIRCPYCRKKQNEVLPYYENMGIQKVAGVNEVYVELSKVKTPSHWANHHCSFVISNGQGDVPMQCYDYGTPICINTHGTNYGDTKLYCWKHKKAVIKQYKKDILDKSKAEALKVKLELKKAKEELKLKEKEEKKLLKKMAKKEKKQSNPLEENIIIGPSATTLIDTVFCTAVLKTGANKGTVCGKKACNVEDKLCIRHSKK